MKRTVMTIGLAVTVTALAAFAVAQEGGMGSDAMGSESMGMASMPMDTPAIHVAQSDTYGAYLVDGQGRTLYTVVNMDAMVPCEGDCAEAWPPFTVESMGMMGASGMGSGGMGSGDMGSGGMAAGDSMGSDQDMGDGGEAMGNSDGAMGEGTSDAMGESMGDDMGDDMGDGMDASMMLPVDADLIDTAARDDGSTQFTYNGHPLYYFVGDVDPGVISCQAVTQFGGTWYIVSPTGEVITTAN